jgi:hypothetical protein
MRQVSQPPRFRHEGQDDIRNVMYHQHVRHEVSADVIAGQGVEQRSAGYEHHTEQVSTPELLVHRGSDVGVL